jgi:haloalkane dehalogenase
MATIAAFRTPDERFADLPGWPYEPSYHEWDGLRMAYVDEGDGEPVLLLHGEPTWGYLWRKVMEPLLAAGHRVVVPDHIGFGRSDKPTDWRWYSWDGHCAALHSLLEALDLRDATMVCHDWGGPIGLRVSTESPERFPRIVMMDTGMWTGKQRMSDAWLTFRDFVERTEDLPIGFLVKGGCKLEMPDEVFAAYEAPFPTPESKAGARAFPLMIPFEEDLPDAIKGRAALDFLAGDGRPKLMLWADSDPVLPVKQGQAVAERINAPAPDVIADAGHFLQEDQGEPIGRRIVDWLAAR